MTINRRGFLQGLGIGTLAAGTAHAGGGIHRFPGHAGSRGLLHDTTLCVGCRSCEATCNEVNHLPEPSPAITDPSAFDERRLLSDGLYTVVNRYREAQGNQPPVFRKHQCMHCAEPCCASVCFVGAFTKTPEGPVLYDPEVCVGCRYCVFACPYYALSYEYDDPITPRVVRCTMCYPRIVRGQSPGCADVCPTGAIQFGERAQLIRVARERIRKFPGRYIDHVFGEHEFAGTSWLTLAGIPLRELELPENVSHEPLPNLTTSFLSLAPLVATIFPGMLGGFYAFTKRKEALQQKALRAAVSQAKAEASTELTERLAAAAAAATRDKEDAVGRARRAALREAMAAQTAVTDAKTADPKPAPAKTAPAKTADPKPAPAETTDNEPAGAKTADKEEPS